MKQIFSTLGALAFGVGAMYYFDPEQGRRRRAMVADRVDSVSHETRDYLEGKRKRTTDRVRGAFARVRSRLMYEPPTDEQLHGQIRSRLGRLVSYPHAIETEVHEGRVVLRGAVLAHEFNILMAGIWAMRGVKAIDSQLSQHTDPSNVPGMQGRPHRTRKARLRNLARSAATALAVTGGIGAALGALRKDGRSHTGLLSLAIALLAYGVGDGAQRLVRRRQFGRPAARRGAERGEAAEARPEEMPERAAETPALVTPPAAWH